MTHSTSYNQSGQVIINQLRPEGTCSRSYVRVIVTSHSLVMQQPHAQALRDSPSSWANRAADWLIFIAVVTVKMCHSSCISLMISALHHPSSPAGLMLEGSKSHRKELNLDSRPTSIQTTSDDRSSVPLKSNNLKLLIKLMGILQPCWVWPKF